jgi:hypothetical protein
VALLRAINAIVHSLEFTCMMWVVIWIYMAYKYYEYGTNERTNEPVFRKWILLSYVAFLVVIFSQSFYVLTL